MRRPWTSCSAATTRPADRLDFLNSTGAWASGANGVTITGVDDIDLWIGGLAEEQMPFGGFLGSTFNFVFEEQTREAAGRRPLLLPGADRRLNFLTELENNSFAKLIMANTSATHLPGDVFSTPGFFLEIDQTRQFNEGLTLPGPDGVLGDDPATPEDESADDIVDPNADPFGDVIRNNPATPGPDTNYLQYTGDQHVVLGGTALNDIINRAKATTRSTAMAATTGSKAATATTSSSAAPATTS